MREPGREGGDRLGVRDRKRDSVLAGEQADRSVHGPGVEIGKVEPRREQCAQASTCRPPTGRRSR